MFQFPLYYRKLNCVPISIIFQETKAKPSDTSQWLDGVVETVVLSDFDLLKVIGRGSFGKVMQVF